MSYRATVLSVMIASPSDVSQERRIARDVLHEWNAVNAADRQVVLMPIGWESHSFPEMGDRPQALINRRLLSECDLLIGIFWTRLGSPTGEAPSGTVEEIEEHLENGRPALIYFSAAPVRPDSVDSTQYSAVKKFKASLRKKGLVEEYDGLAAFREKLARHLAQAIIAEFSGGEPTEELAPVPGRSAPPLSDAAKELLQEASKDSGGAIMSLGALGGYHVQTNGREFVAEKDARSEARWRGAVDELASLGLVEDRVGKGEVFFITDSGYAVADALDTA